MKKADKVLIVCIMLLSLALFVPIFLFRPEPKVAVVKVQQKEVLRINLQDDQTYEVEGSLGPVHIEVKDQKIRVTQENSPLHICSKQGFVSDANVPIVCLPNDTVITIEEQQVEDTLIR